MPVDALGVIAGIAGLLSNIQEGLYLLQKGAKKGDVRRHLAQVKQKLRELGELEKSLPIEIRLGIMDIRPDFFKILEESMERLDVDQLKPHPRYKIWSTKAEVACKERLRDFSDETRLIRADLVKSTNAVRKANGISRTATLVSWEPTKIPDVSLIEMLSTQARTFGEPKPTRAVDDIDVPPSAAETARRRLRLSRTVRRLIPKKKPPPTIPVDRLVSPGASTSAAIYIPLQTIETRDTLVDPTPDEEPGHSCDPSTKVSPPADDDLDGR